MIANQLRCTSKSVDRYAATIHAFSAPAPSHDTAATRHGTAATILSSISGIHLIDTLSPAPATQWREGVCR